MQDELDQIRIKKAQDDINKQANIDNQLISDTFINTQAIDAQSEENVNLEIQIDTEEKLIRMRSNNLETEKATQDQTFNEKRQKMIDMINSLQEAISKAEKKEEVESEISKSREENNKVKEDIDALEAEIAQIKSQILSEEQMKKIKDDMQKEINKLKKEESEIRTALLDLKGDERELQEYEEEITQKTTSIENDKYFYQKNGLAIQQELNIVQSQVEQVKKKCKIAYNNYLKEQKKK